MIHKNKIIEIWDYSHSNVIKYTQNLVVGENEALYKFEGETLTELKMKVNRFLIESKEIR